MAHIKNEKVLCTYILPRGLNKGESCNTPCRSYSEISRCYKHCKNLIKNKERYKENKDEYKKGGKYYTYVKEGKKAQIQKIQHKDIPFVPQTENTIRYHEGKLYIELVSRIEIPLTDEILQLIKEC